MKSLLIVALNLFSLSTLSLEIPSKVLDISNHKIEAIVSEEGIYSRLIDIKEGFEIINGINLGTESTKIDLDLFSTGQIILINGNTISVKADKVVFDGGDMGGGDMGGAGK